MMPDNDAELAAADGFIQVRRITPESWRDYRTVRLSALASDPLAFCTTLDEEQRCEEQRWIERSSLNSTYDVQGAWIAYDGNTPVGVAGITSSAAGFSLCHMWVNPGWRGKGIGKRLASTAIDWVLSGHPSAVIRLDVNPSQVAAVRMYATLGFILTGKEEKMQHEPARVTVEMLLKK